MQAQDTPQTQPTPFDNRQTPTYMITNGLMLVIYSLQLIWCGAGRVAFCCSCRAGAG